MDKLWGIFDEWTEYALRTSLRPRRGWENLLEFSASKPVFLTGIRRSGKSSLMMLLAQKAGGRVGYVNLEDHRLPDEPSTLDSVLSWHGDKGFLFLDEISSVKDWAGWLARVHEQTKGKLFLIVSSSVFSFPPKSLRGRLLRFELFPLSFEEFLEFKGYRREAKTVAERGRMFQWFYEYLVWGGFPEVVLAEEDFHRLMILSSYFSDIIALDVAEKNEEDIGLVKAVARYLMETKEFSASKTRNFLKTIGWKCGKERLLSLEDSLSRAYLFFFLEIFSGKIKDKLQYPRKVYPGDTGFFKAITNKEERGRLYKTAVFLAIRRNLSPLQEINYWKSQRNGEIDFVVRRGKNVEEIIQVTSGEDIKPREYKAALEAAESLGIKEITFIGDVEGEEKKGGVKFRFRNIVDWLLKRGQV